jgi:hypothetical protein
MGYALLSLPELWNVTKLSIERNPWDSEQMAIPYPTSFHPASDVEMVAWRSTIRNAKRNKLVVFVGSPRYNKVGGTDLRRELMRQCSGAGNGTWSDRDNDTTTAAAAAAGIANSNRTKDPSRSCTMVLCNVVGCARNPQAPIRAFLEAVFCLQPPGDSATRKSFFDCLIAGGIPVLFDNMSAAQQYQWHLPRNTSSYAITFNRKQVRARPSLSLSLSHSRPLSLSLSRARPHSLSLSQRLRLWFPFLHSSVVFLLRVHGHFASGRGFDSLLGHAGLLLHLQTFESQVNYRYLILNASVGRLSETRTASAVIRAVLSVHC